MAERTRSQCVVQRGIEARLDCWICLQDGWGSYSYHCKTLTRVVLMASGMGSSLLKPCSSLVV